MATVNITISSSGLRQTTVEKVFQDFRKNGCLRKLSDDTIAKIGERLLAEFNEAGKEVIDALVAACKKKFGKEASIYVRKDAGTGSRSSRLADAMSGVNDAANEVESLRDELQDWYDNLPEAFQNGSKGEELQDAISSLEDIHGELEQVAGRDGDVSFPGMY